MARLIIYPFFFLTAYHIAGEYFWMYLGFAMVIGGEVIRWRYDVARSIERKRQRTDPMVFAESWKVGGEEVYIDARLAGMIKFGKAKRLEDMRMDWLEDLEAAGNQSVGDRVHDDRFRIPTKVVYAGFGGRRTETREQYAKHLESVIMKMANDYHAILASTNRSADYVSDYIRHRDPAS